MALENANDWQSQRSLADCMRYMLDKEISSDVCFEVGPSNGETVHIHAHKFMLIARSPVFQAMFSSGMSECSDPVAKVRIEDIDADIFKELLIFIYCERISASVCALSAVHLLYAAKKYMLFKLANECVAIISESLNVSNVIHFLEQGLQYDHKELQSECLRLISANAKAVFRGAEILSASRHAMESILDSERISASEYLIFRTAVNWAKHRLQSEGKNQTDLRVREVLDDLLYKIRFPVMKGSEFAEICAESSLLTEEEKDSVWLFRTKREKRQLKFPTEWRFGEELFVDRTVTYVCGRWWMTPTVDAINFKTDLDILLTGIGLYSGHTESGYDVDVEIFKAVHLLSTKSVKVPYTGDAIPFKVELDEPVYVAAGEMCTIKTWPRHFVGFYDTVCAAACTEGRVTFTFLKHTESLKTTEIYGQIPRLFFCYV